MTALLGVLFALAGIGLLVLSCHPPTYRRWLEPFTQAYFERAKSAQPLLSETSFVRTQRIGCAVVGLVLVLVGVLLLRG